MTTYKIIHYTAKEPLGINVVETNCFKKSAMELAFESLVKKLIDGESAEYMKEDNVFFYPSMQYVVKENGVLYSYTASGNRRVSKYNN
jgi:ribosomal protein S3AE